MSYCGWICENVPILQIKRSFGEGEKPIFLNAKSHLSSSEHVLYTVPMNVYIGISDYLEIVNTGEYSNIKWKK